MAMVTKSQTSLFHHIMIIMLTPLRDSPGSPHDLFLQHFKSSQCGTYKLHRDMHRIILSSHVKIMQSIRIVVGSQCFHRLAIFGSWCEYGSKLLITCVIQLLRMSLTVTTSFIWRWRQEVLRKNYGKNIYSRLAGYKLYSNRPVFYAILSLSQRKTD